jgi:RND family efflux transporter MFP subunit
VSTGAATAAAAPSAREVIGSFQALRALTPGSEGYWTRFADSLQRLCRAQAAWLLQHRDTSWTVLGRSAGAQGTDQTQEAAWQDELDELTARAQAQGHAACPRRLPDGRTVWWACVRLPRLPGGWALLQLDERERGQLNELLLRAQLVADLPSASAAAVPDAAPAAPARPAADLAGLLDISAQVMLCERFGSATLTLVNALAAHHGASQVALGWRTATGIEAVAISHLERFDRRSQQVVLTEDALDEALDHDTPITLARGAPAGSLAAHALLQQALGDVHLLSLPLSKGEDPTRAVLLLSFSGDAPAAGLAQALQPALELMLPWLDVLHARERAWPLRLRDAALAQLRAWLGPEHAALKALAVALGLFVVYALLASWDYRIHASGQMATDSTRILSAQFDGRIEEARASAGDTVRAGQVLATLDTRDLRQQEIDARAELNRYTAEADKARAAGALAELEIASARAAQAQARLSRVSEQLAQAVQTAPFDGVVVEGERKELQGAPVRKGDKLYRVARIEGLYAVVQVSERDAAQVHPGASGELVLVGRTDQAIPLKVTAVVPVAQTKGQEGNHFQVRAELATAPEAWWRPGMSGAVRIDAGERNVAWILTHRLVDTVRLALWW